MMTGRSLFIGMLLVFGNISIVFGVKTKAEASQFTTTITKATGNFKRDDWAVVSNWNNGVPSGNANAVVAAGINVVVDGLYDKVEPTIPTYSGNLTLQADSSIRLEHTQASNAVVGVANIVLGQDASLLTNFKGTLHLPHIQLDGDASVSATSTGSMGRTTKFHEITGDHTLTLVGINAHKFYLNEANTFSGLISNSRSGGHHLYANAPGSLGRGDVTINPGSKDGSSAELVLQVAGTIADTATLTLNGKGYDPTTSERITIAAGVAETIGMLVIDGVQMPPGTYDNTVDWLSGDGTLIVEAAMQDCIASATTRSSGSWARWPSAPAHKLNDNEFIFVTHVGQNVHMALVDRANRSRGSRFNDDQTVDVWNQTQVLKAWNTGTDWYIDYMGDLTNISINCPA